MPDQTICEAAAAFIDAQPERGLVHYVDLAAVLAEHEPSRFSPSEGRQTPHYTLWRKLNESEEFETMGEGWFRYHRWGDVGERKLALSADGGTALKAASAALRNAGHSSSAYALDAILDDPDRRAAEVALRASAITRAGEILSKDELDSDDVADLLKAWSTCGGRKPGSEQANRFAPAFMGMYVNKYQDQLPMLNAWIAELSAVANDAGKVAQALDNLWARRDLEFAGIIFPTMVLHTLSPTRWFPWTDTLARGLASAGFGDGRADGSGAGYLAYCESVRAFLAREGFDPHLADAALAREALAAAAGTDTGRATEQEPGFGPAGFDLLTALRGAEGAGREWFEPHRAVYRQQVRGPLVALVVHLGQHLIDPLVNRRQLLGDDEIVIEPKRVVARINAQAPLANGSQYYPYLWAAFFPASHGRRQGACQLFITLHPEGLDVGLALDTAPREARDRFVQALHGPSGPRLAAWLENSPTLHLRGYARTHRPASIEELAGLADEASSISLVVRLSREVVGQEKFRERAEEALRALLPFFVAALVTDPTHVLDALGVGSLLESGDDEGAEEEEDVATGAVGYSLDDLQRETCLEKPWLREVALAATFLPKTRGAVGQIVLYGPPGTGKTWLAEHIAHHLVDGDSTRIEMVQLHPAFSYEHMMEGYVPAVKGDNLVFERRDGVLLRLRERILQTGKRHVLVLDEMNRGDLPLILGELMYLLSRRGQRSKVRLAKSGSLLDLPDLLSIIGTMNTADRSISHVDFALRRRFRFFRAAPEPRVIEAIVGPRHGSDWAAKLSRLLSETNDLLGQSGRGFEIGHSYLLDVNGPEALREVWDREVLPTIEDWLDFDPVALKPFALDRLLKKVEREDSSAGAADGDGVDGPA